MSSPLTLTYQDRIAILTMDNPPANTWTPESLLELQCTIEALNNNNKIIALIITSASDKFFSAGADLKRFEDASKEDAQLFAEAFGQAFEALSDFNGLSIAAINGYAMGGGLEVALACDLRVAEQQALMALPETGVGLLPCAGGTQNLTLLIGEAWAKRMILCGEKVNAKQALTLGLVEEVVASGQAFAKAQELAEKACRQSPDALKACKHLIQLTRKGFSRDALATERTEFVALFSGKNQQEGVRAFIEKRQPDWVIE